MSAILYVAGGAVLGVLAFGGWLVWYFRDVFR